VEKIEIIPGILVHTLKELKEKLHLLSWAKKVHIDIMDGKFVPNKTIQANDIRKAMPKMDMQIHLMAYNPHKYIKPFAQLGVKELIIHAESTKKLAETLEDIRLAGMKSGIAFNPETPVKHHKDAIQHADIGLIMTVKPGASGQEMRKEKLLKLLDLVAYNLAICRGVDGGVNLSNCKMAAKQAHFLIATHAITDAENPQKAYNAMMTKC
jgi:ribulose-phosphate 3-epimerase